MSPAEIHALQNVFLSTGMVFALCAILGTLIRIRKSRTIFDRYGFGVFGIYHVAMFGERRK